MLDILQVIFFSMKLTIDGSHLNFHNFPELLEVVSVIKCKHSDHKRVQFANGTHLPVSFAF